MIELRVKEYLKEANITQTELAERLGITPSALSKRLTSSLTLQQLGEIADALHTSAFLLIEENGQGRGEVNCPQCGYLVKVTLVAK
jgi:transcriptional regulator with XRE-family HTH domain